MKKNGGGKRGTHEKTQYSSKNIKVREAFSAPEVCTKTGLRLAASTGYPGRQSLPGLDSDGGTTWLSQFFAQIYTTENPCLKYDSLEKPCATNYSCSNSLSKVQNFYVAL